MKKVIMMLGLFGMLLTGSFALFAGDGCCKDDAGCCKDGCACCKK